MGNREQAKEILETVKLLKNRLDQLHEDVPEAVDDYHHIFLYFVGEQFEGVSPEKLRICDRSPGGDQKIDFYEANEDRFTVYQCKLPEIENLERRAIISPFNADLVNEAEDILTFLTDNSGHATGSTAAQEARTRYRSFKRMSEEENQVYKLEVVIACFGNLTAPAREKLEELRHSWNNDNEEFTIKVIDYDIIARVLTVSSIFHSPPTQIKLKYKKGTSVNTNEWGYALIPAYEFYQQFDKYKMALFDQNVRYYLERSSVNKQIINSLNTTRGQKRFHLLNNGITISSTSCSFSDNHSKVTIHKPQIINGCQTVISIFRAFNQINGEFKRRHFQDNCYVPVRIIQTKNSELLEELVTTSNNQNKMSPRNLRSNSLTQRLLQRKFDQLRHGYFYQRKDGEFKSIKDYNQGHQSTFRPKRYQAPTKGPRVIDNEDLAKAWLSFVGFSKDASEKINAFEFTRYEWLFERRPSEDHWSVITLGPQVEFNEEMFEPSTPDPEQYLLSYIIFEFTKAYLPTPQGNRADCISRLKATAQITDTMSAEEINTALMRDEVYVLNQILYNMKEVIVELYSWTLITAYGPLNTATADQILNLAGFRDLYETPDFRSFVSRLRTNIASGKLEDNILFNCIEFIKEAVTRWKSIHEQEYLGQQRRIRYLHTSRVVEQMKYSLSKTNEDTRRSEYEWKPREIEFLQSLPKL